MPTLLETVWKGMQSGQLTADGLPDLGVDDGQSLQLQVLSTYLRSGEKLAGYKIGLTSGAARNAFGEGVRPFGYILRSRVFESGASISMDAIGRLGLENELVFRIGHDLKGGDVTAADARLAVEAVAPGFEINQSRAEGKLSNGMRVADNLSQWGIVTGKFQSPDRDLDDLEVSLHASGKAIQTVSAKNHIDDHFESLATLARELHRHKRHLRPGVLVITGSFTRHAVIEPGEYVGSFGTLGDVSIHVTEGTP